ncbi:MAG: asparagine synthetase B, partial [Chromatiaceae bacterium]|nr:asparagine synthetase B [Chromatiaceae bacterium]
MSGIFGCWHGGGDPALVGQGMAMDRAMAHWGPDGGDTWHDDHCALGQRLLYNTPEAVHERLPRWVPEARLAITAEARIDNRDELCDHFAISPAERPTTPDSDLILRAYLKWGEASPEHLLGDWSFAVWHPDARKLFLARDHHGNTSLCYWRQGERFAFASAPQALHAIGAPRRLNELYLAQVLISWPAYHGPQTIDLDIQRLPPAHALTVTPQGMRVWRYWRLEDTPELRLPRREDYVQGLLEVYDKAVRCRLRSYRPVGVTLSGGLDSGSVTALAARELARQGQRLTAFTAVPRYDTARMTGPKCFGDETEYAAATAAFCGNVDHVLLDSTQVTPLAGIRRTLAIMPGPAHGASNAFWISDLLEHAQAAGLGTLLTGQCGNATVSWTGAPELRSRLAAFQHGGWKAGIRRNVPLCALRPLMRMRARGQDWSGTAIHPDFARRMALSARRITAMGQDVTLRESWREPHDMRCAIAQPGMSRLGDHWAQRGAAAGLEVRDPTQDQRVMAYSLAVPDECPAPCDYIPRRSYPLFSARAVLRLLRAEAHPTSNRATRRPAS